MTALLPRAILIGDSQAEGLAPHLRTALAPVFHVVNTIWQRGASTRAIVEGGKIEAALTQHPDVVIFALGGNDTANASYRDTLIEAVGRAARDGARVIWIGPAASRRADVAARHDGARNVQRELLPALGVLWLDSSAWTTAGFAEDGVHFTRAAYAEQARAVARAIAEARDGAATAIGRIPTWAWLTGGAAGAAAIVLGVWAGTRT